VGGLVAPSALISGRVDTDVGAMQVNVVTAAAIANAAIDAATFAAGAIDAAAIAADALTSAKIDASFSNEVADALLKRDIDQVEATAPKHSLTTAILKAVSRIVDNAGSLETYRTDGITLHLAQVITVNAGADPIDELAVGL